MAGIVADAGPILQPMPDVPRPSLAYPPVDSPPIDLSGVVSVHDFEAPARERLHQAAWAYYAGGSWDEHTLRANATAWDHFHLRPRVLVDASGVTVETTILGRPASMPIGVAPAALHGLAHPDGELATARAAAGAGAINVVSTVASRSIEEIAAAAPHARRWFQLYVQRDWSVTRGLVERAAAAGYEALVLTVDAPVLGYRDEILRITFDPGEDAYANLPKRDAWRHGGELDEILDMRGVHLTWDTLDEIRSWAPLPLVLKGILTAEDARLAVERGADAVWVSNHGGRQLDRSPAGIEVLEEVVDAVEGRAEVYLDGGIRRGPDVLVALALGATAVFTARPFLYALACAGEEGVAKALAILRDEAERALAVAGVTRPSDLRKDHVRVPGAARA
jgi:4-hydroxymandelate oxidase